MRTVIGIMTIHASVVCLWTVWLILFGFTPVARSITQRLANDPSLIPFFLCSWITVIGVITIVALIDNSS
ncbi:hypothetical protein C8R44DRAFT_811335, partial [Mycena epipterygia]